MQRKLNLITAHRSGCGSGWKSFHELMPGIKLRLERGESDDDDEHFVVTWESFEMKTFANTISISAHKDFPPSFLICFMQKRHVEKVEATHSVLMKIV